MSGELLRALKSLPDKIMKLMKNNIIKFVPRHVFESRKCPLHAFSIVPHLNEMLIQLYRDGEFLEPHLTQRAKELIRKLESSNGKAGVQG